MACHLFYWGKVALVYPVCTSNVYVVSGYVPDPVSRRLEDAFTDKFPGEYLEEYLQVGYQRSRKRLFFKTKTNGIRPRIPDFFTCVSCCHVSTVSV